MDIAMALTIITTIMIVATCCLVVNDVKKDREFRDYISLELTQANENILTAIRDINEIKKQSINTDDIVSEAAKQYQEEVSALFGFNGNR